MKTTLHLIAAVARGSHAIGYQGKLPWKNVDDLRIFNMLTDNSYIVCGKRTRAEMPTRGRSYWVWDGKEDPAVFMDRMAEVGIRQAWLCGGAHTYLNFEPFVNGNRIINYVDYDGPYDATFPVWAYKV